MTRSPLRISLGGGGTDLPSYYQEHSGFLIAAAIDKYVYILMHQSVRPADPPQVLADGGGGADRGHQAPVDPRGAAAVGVGGLRLEITSMADIPAGTGLGSSGSFTTALLKALHVAG